MRTTDTDVVPVRLPNGAELLVEVSRERGPQEVSGRRGIAAPEFFSLDGLREALEGLVQLVHSAVRAVAPDKVSVELALSCKASGGKLTAVLVQGGAESSLKITLEWTPGSQ